MLPLLLLSSALAGDLENNTFAILGIALEASTPDVRVEVAPGNPVQAVLAWPISAYSGKLAGWPGPNASNACRTHLLVEPYVEPQLRLSDGQFRVHAGSWLVLANDPGRVSVGVLGGAAYDPSGVGWAAGLGTGYGLNPTRSTRTRAAITGRWTQTPGGGRADVGLDIAFPLAGQGWRQVTHTEPVEDHVRPLCEPYVPPPPEPRPGINDPEFDHYKQDWRPKLGCDVYGCGPGACGEMPDGCGGTMNCGACPGDELPFLPPKRCPTRCLTKAACSMHLATP